MSDPVVRSRLPEGLRALPAAIRDPDLLASRLSDAAHVPGGHASELFAPASEAEVAAVLHASRHLLVVGAQSSLTGGATPMGETLMATHRLNRIERLGPDRVRAGAGVTLAELDTWLAREGWYYPPAPTYTGASVGGTISTNAAGAATFKYGATRAWVEGLTVVLASGDVLDLERGTGAHDGTFELALAAGPVCVPAPSYAMPAVPKTSAGYFSAPGMDLVDLFVGSEGTLGVITAATLRVLTPRPALCLALIFCDDDAVAWSLVRDLRAAAMASWHTHDPLGIDASAIEYMDARSLTLLREDGVDRRSGVVIPATARAALLVTLELPPGTTAALAYDEIGRAFDTDAPASPLARVCRMLDARGVLDAVAFAAPGDQARAAQLTDLREAVPAAVNRRVGVAQQTIDRRIEKIAGDIVVPFERVSALLDFCRREFRDRGLDAAVWGHASDGNLHPNVIPCSTADVEAGREAVLAIGREAIRLEGSPLAEHGVGRNPTKQHLLRELYGNAGIEEMRRTKQVLDPDGKLAPGVLFPRDGHGGGQDVPSR